MMDNINHGSQKSRVPSDFSEFYAEYPTYVRNFVRRYMKWHPVHEQLDRESELISFLLTLPDKSKFRCSGASGRPGGCTDRIMTFDPERVHGGSAGLFFGYLNRILRNQFLNLEARRQSNPVTRRGTLRIVEDDSRDDSRTGGSEIDVERVSNSQQHQSPRPSESPEEHATVSRFLDFVRELNPELIPVLESILSCAKFAKAQADLGLDDRSFGRARSRLRLLYTCFATGRPVPKQRRVYRTSRTRNTRFGYDRGDFANEVEVQ
jgi:hypothetical protein